MNNPISGIMLGPYSIAIRVSIASESLDTDSDGGT